MTIKEQEKQQMIDECYTKLDELDIKVPRWLEDNADQFKLYTSTKEIIAEKEEWRTKLTNLLK